MCRGAGCFCAEIEVIELLLRIAAVGGGGGAVLAVPGDPDGLPLRPSPNDGSNPHTLYLFTPISLTTQHVPPCLPVLARSSCPKAA